MDEIRETVDVLSRTLPGLAVHTLAEEGEPYADQLSLDNLHTFFKAEPYSIRHIVRHAVFELLREYGCSSGELFHDCHTAFQGTQNPLVEPIRSMCRDLPR